MPRKGPVPSQDPVYLCCPSCGFDLAKARPIRTGELYADPMGETYWKGQRVQLSVTHRLILSGILLAAQNKQFATKLALAERSDITIDSLDVMIMQIRDRFKNVDPEFAHIVTEYGEGYKWVDSIEVKRVLIAAPEIPLTLYDNGEAYWQNRFIVKLPSGGNKGNEMRVLKVLLAARGEFVSTEELTKRADISCKEAMALLISKLRKRFAAQDPKSEIIIAHKGRGYAAVKPNWTKPVWKRAKVGQTKFEISGLLTFRADGEVFWQDKHRVFLTPLQSKLFGFLLDADGNWLTSTELSRQMGQEGNSEKRSGMSRDSVVAMMKKIQKQFAAADPNTSLIEAKRSGYRLRLPLNDRQKLFETEDLLVYRSGRTTWQGIYDLELTKRQLEVLHTIADDGGWIRGQEILESLSGPRITPGSVSSCVKTLQKVFAAFDSTVPVITTHPENGYRLVSSSEAVTETEEVRLAA